MLTENSTKEEVLAAFKAYGSSTVLKSAPEKIRSNKEFMLEGVQMDGYALAYASRELTEDKEVVLAAVRQSKGWAVFYASELMRQDSEVQKTVEDLNSWAYEQFILGDGFKYNGNPSTGDSILSSAKQQKLSELFKNPLMLQTAPGYIKDHKKIVTALVQRNGLALEFASERLQDYIKVVALAVLQNGNAIDFASEPLQKNQKLLGYAAQNSGIVGWFYYGIKSLYYRFFVKDPYEHLKDEIDFSVYEMIDELNTEVNSRKRFLNDVLVDLAHNMEQQYQTQEQIDESLRHTVRTVDETGKECELMKEALKITEEKLDATSTLLQEKDDELAILIGQLQNTQAVLAQKEALLDEAVLGLQDSKLKFDQQIERLSELQNTIGALALEKDKALELVSQIEQRHELFERKNNEYGQSLQESKELIVLVNANNQLLVEEHIKMKEDLEKSRTHEKSLMEKIKTLETSRAMLLRQLQTSQGYVFLDNDSDEETDSTRHKNSSRFSH